MPFGDGTGPAGTGPMRRGFGRGGGRGWRNRYYATGLTGWQRAGLRLPYNSPAHPFYCLGEKQELDILKSQADYLVSLLKDVNARITELEKEESK